MEKIPLPNKFELTDTGEHTAQLVIQPLFSGFGTTIGNALRRVLLSSMPGAAIKSIKIEGVNHEFSTMEGVKEDIVDIVLNFKQIRLKIHTNEEVRLSLKVKGKKAVTAGDISPNSDVEIVNGDQHLATITKEGVEFNVEIIASRGRGYIPTEARKDEEREIGMIAIDSIYTPIKNVSLDVDNVRVGQVTTFEQVVLDIETDGTITPKEAVALSAQILIDHFSLVVESDLEPQTERTDDDEVEEDNMVDEPAFDGMNEVEAPAPKRRGRPRKEDTVDDPVEKEPEFEEEAPTEESTDEE